MAAEHPHQCCVPRNHRHLDDGSLQRRHSRRTRTSDLAGANWQDGSTRRDRQCRRLAVFGCVLLHRRARPGRRWRSNSVVMFVANTIKP